MLFFFPLFLSPVTSSFSFSPSPSLSLCLSGSFFPLDRVYLPFSCYLFSIYSPHSLPFVSLIHSVHPSLPLPSLSFPLPRVLSLRLPVLPSSTALALPLPSASVIFTLPSALSRSVSSRCTSLMSHSLILPSLTPSVSPSLFCLRLSRASPSAAGLP